MSTQSRQVVKKGQNLVNVVKECPLKRRPVIVKVKKCFELSYPGWQTYAKSFFSNVCLAQMGLRNNLVQISILNRLDLKLNFLK